MQSYPPGRGGIKPAVNQCKLSVVHYDAEVIAYCAREGITYQVQQYNLTILISSAMDQCDGLLAYITILMRAARLHLAS